MLDSIKAWIKAKGGVAHIIALTYIFLVAAYQMVPEFKQFVLTIHQTLPSWLQALGTTIVALVAFYKTWNAGQRQINTPPQP